MTPSARGRAVAVVQVRGRGRPDRHEDAAADGLDEPRGDELVEALGGPGQGRPDDEHDERPEEQPAGAPQVGEPAGEGHDQRCTRAGSR